MGNVASASRFSAMWVALAVVLAATVAAPAHADTNRLVFVGLRPLVQATGDGDLTRLPEAQAVRAIAQRALQDVSGQPVVGHDELARILGKAYLVAFFNCAGNLSCMGRAVAPLRRIGSETAVTGDYTVVDGTYHVRLVAFMIVDGKPIKEIAFDLAEDRLKDPTAWRDPSVRILSNASVRVRSNVGGTACTIDATPCVFEADQQTLAVMPGEHTIELAKDQYETARSTVHVTTGSTTEVTVALTPIAIANRAGDKPERGKPDPGKPGDTLRPPSPTDQASRGHALTAVRTTQVPTIDGKLDDPAWQKAWLETSFTQHFPDENKPPAQRTEVRVLYNDEAIYLGIRCFDTHPEKIVAQLTRRDRDNSADRVTVDISSKNDKASAYHFQVNAAGVQLDGLRFNDTDYSNDWDGRWYSATSIDAQGWTVELMIPLVTLRYTGDLSSFGFQVRRYLGRTGEIDEWAYVPSTAKGEVSHYGTLEGLDNLNAKRLFEILAYDSRRVVRRGGQGAFDGTDQDGNLGADLKLGITPALTLDATINPDFGTIEVDQVVLNLTTLETYYPEKRPFFIEGADLFATPFSLFYSRRIGATPPGPSVGQLAEPPPSGSILGALKLSGVLTGRLSVAVLDAISPRKDAVIERSPGMTEALLVDPLSNFGVLRLRQEFGTNSSVGMIATAVNRIEPANAAAPRPDDLCPVPYTTTFTSLEAPVARGGRCTNDAYAAGLDTVLRTDDGEWGLSAQIVGSRIENGPTRIIPDGTAIGSGSSGFASTLEAGRYGGENWLFKLSLRDISPTFQINDLGYLDQGNYHELTPTIIWRTTTPTALFQAASVELSVYHRRDWKLRNISTDPRLILGVQLKNLWELSLTAEPYYPTWFENRETQDGARTQRNSGYYYSAQVKTDPKNTVVLEVDGSYLHNLGGLTMLRGSSTLSLRPKPTLELDLIANVRREWHGPRWVETDPNADGSRTYYFADLDARTVDLTLRGTYTFSRKLSLQAYLQPFVASGHYTDPTSSTASGSDPDLTLASFVPASTPSGTLPDFRTGAINLNLFVRYEYQPLSALWLVYSRNQEQTAYDPTEGKGRLRIDRFGGGPSTDVLLIKLSYLW